MNINEISLKLDFPKELLEAIGDKEIIIAGGSVLRRLLRVPTEGTDIDVFFYGGFGDVNILSVAHALKQHGFVVLHEFCGAYIHERQVLKRDDIIIDLVHEPMWATADDVFDSFDISVAQVGYNCGWVAMTEEAALDLIRKELRVLNPNKWPTTPQRVEKYCATFGLRVVDNL